MEIGWRIHRYRVKHYFRLERNDIERSKKEISDCSKKERVRGEITFLIRIKCGIIEKNFFVHLISGFPNFHLSFQRSSVIEFLNLKLQISKLSCPTLESANNNLLFIWLDLRDQVTRVANSILTKKVREDNGR